MFIESLPSNVSISHNPLFTIKRSPIFKKIYNLTFPILMCSVSDNNIGVFHLFGQFLFVRKHKRQLQHIYPPRKPGKGANRSTLEIVFTQYLTRQTSNGFPGREAGDSPPSNVDVKDGGAVPPLPMRLQGVVFN
jgi:hypothetical protein